MAKSPSKQKKREPKSKSKTSPATQVKSAQKVEVIEPEIVGFEDENQATTVDPLSGTLDVDALRTELESVGDIVIDPDKETDLDQALPILTPEIIEPIAKQAKPSTALTITDPVTLYLAEIRKYPLLTKEKEQELALRYRETGDAKAAEVLVTSNLRFVVKIAAEYSRFGAKLIDLIQEGNVGLMHAVKEFNPYKGVRLITYAVWWIRGYIQEYLMRQYSLVRIGTTQNQRKLFYRLQKEREALDSLGIEPSYALLAGRLGVSEEEVATMSQRLSGRDVSLNQPLDSGGGATSAASLLDFEASQEVSVDEQIAHLEEMEVLKQNIEKIRPTLNEKEKFILENRILSDEPMTLQEIGNHYGITREAVRQLEARLISRIRTAFQSSLDE